MTEAERRAVRTALLRQKFVRNGRSKKEADGGYTERWERTVKGKVVATVLIEWAEGPKR